MFLWGKSWKRKFIAAENIDKGWKKTMRRSKFDDMN